MFGTHFQQKFFSDMTDSSYNPNLCYVLQTTLVVSLEKGEINPKDLGNLQLTLLLCWSLGRFGRRQAQPRL